MPPAAPAPVVFVAPGDLHLTEPGRDNHRTALRVVDEVNRVVRPDFVQFVGDDVQHARPEEFRLFRELAGRLEVPWHALVGDHDVENDPAAEGFRRHVGETYGAAGLRGFRFVRLDTPERRPLGIGAAQAAWFRAEVDAAQARGERVVVFQHDYPYQIWETFDGPGVDAWREVVQTRRVTGIVTGHTHYHQVANDGRNVAVAVRSVGDPEGGPPGYLVGFLHGDDFAAVYRAAGDDGPLALITHPRDVLLATGPAHAVSGPDRVHVSGWSAAPVTRAEARLDGGPWFPLEADRPGAWSGPLAGGLSKGDHLLEARLVDAAGRAGGHALPFMADPTGRAGGHALPFMADPTGRYTAVPAVRPVVKATTFC